MILEDFYFIGHNQAEMFWHKFSFRMGIIRKKVFFRNLKDNSFQIDVDLKDHDQEDLLPLLVLPGGLLSAGPGNWTNSWVAWDCHWGLVHHLVDNYLLLHGIRVPVTLDLVQVMVT